MDNQEVEKLGKILRDIHRTRWTQKVTKLTDVYSTTIGNFRFQLKAGYTEGSEIRDSIFQYSLEVYVQGDEKVPIERESSSDSRSQIGRLYEDISTRVNQSIQNTREQARVTFRKEFLE